eukprot:TRINITY_DN58982_c0_g1_i1.p1 TRINITY_DN58982_c0_g1~~TRINITY_DN58982_c0_g1_i1.p1  ORF type:complete len:285 (+),score=30.97 TRINITY_DN58982_c0_g1_i1:97-951(+)
MAKALRCLTLPLVLMLWTQSRPQELSYSFVGHRITWRMSYAEESMRLHTQHRYSPFVRRFRNARLETRNIAYRLTCHASGRSCPSGAKILGDRIWMDVTLTKPLGIKLEGGPDGEGSGVGVGEVLEGGSAAALIDEAIAEGAPPLSWIQEGDELLAVNGNLCRGSLKRAVEMISEADGSEVTLKIQRKKRGNVQVVFPGGLHVTAPRKTPLPQVAQSVGYDWGSNVWHQDEATGEMYDVSSLDCMPGFTPSKWAEHGEDGVKNEVDGIEFENWYPLVLKVRTKA